MCDYIKIPREIFPGCKLPENIDTPVWRYMDEEKFYWLLQKKEVYLCRGDLLQDRFEGSYSRQQILSINDWLKAIGEVKLIPQERERRIRDRKKTYISCWCVGDCDYDLMWKAYIRKNRGVVIKSSVRKLQSICDINTSHWPLDVSLVTYSDYKNGEIVNYIGAPDIFLKKDKHFMLDNELRIIHWPNITEPTPDYIGLPVEQLNNLIEQVLLQPKSNLDFLKSVKESLKRVGLEKIPVYYSRDDRELVE